MIIEITTDDLLKSFYDETAKEERKKHFDYLMQDAETENRELIRELWDRRYIDASKGRPEVDRFIRGWVHLNVLRIPKGKKIGRKMFERDKQEIRDDLAFDFPEKYGETGKELLYKEYVNLVRFYIAVCEEDRGFSSVILGIGRMKKTSLTNKIAYTIYHILYEVGDAAGMGEELSMLRKAALEAFCAVYKKESDREYYTKRLEGKYQEDDGDN